LSLHTYVVSAKTNKHTVYIIQWFSDVPVTSCYCQMSTVDIFQPLFHVGV